MEQIRNSETLKIFKLKILKFIRPTANSIFSCRNPTGVKLLARVRLRLSHSFQDKLNLLCCCGKEFETVFLLSCSNYSDKKLALLRKIRNINPNILENTNPQFTHFLLYGDNNLTDSTNFIILSSTTQL